MSVIDDVSIRLQAIIETAIDGIITIDSNGIIEQINQAATELFNYDEHELIGKNISVLMPRSHGVRHNSYIKRYLETKKASIIGVGREVEGIRKDGKRFPFRLAVSEVILNDRIIFTGIIHDLTETKSAQEELKSLNTKLETKIAARTEELEQAINILLKTNRQLEKREEELKNALAREKELGDLKSRFVTTASHEFRTPLSTILSSASLINRYQLTEHQPKRERHIGKIKSAVDNLTGILNDFLSLSKLEEGKVFITKQIFNLDQMIIDIFSELQGIKKEAQVLIKEIPPGLIINTDKRTLKNILFNLLSNAIKYSNKGEIKVSSKFSNGILKLVVSDQGMGIPENEQKHLFGRFFRASNVESIQGTGLGLSIVKRYVELLEGSIDFESKEYVGTTFIIKIPTSND